MSTDELLAFLFEEAEHPLAPSLAAWLTSSRRFTAFVTAFRDKIRKKARTAQDRENLLDLLLEWETAYLLLQERALSLSYEPLPATPSRGPDFAVAFTTSVTFMLEVTRLRTAATPPSDVARTGERLADTVCSKLGQLSPQCGNVLLLGVEELSLTSDDLRAAMRRVPQRAESGDVSFLQRYRFRDRGAFFRHYQRLSEILVRGPHPSAAEPTLVWVNPQARHPLPSRVRAALYRSHAAFDLAERPAR